MPSSDADINAILAKYGLAPQETRRSGSLWQTITQPIKTLVGATGGALPGLLLGSTDLYQEAKQRELEQLAAARGVRPDQLTTAEQVEALPGLGSVLTSADVFDENVLGRIAKPVVRLAGDIVGDPTSFIGGIGAVSKLKSIGAIAKGANVASTLEKAALIGKEASFLDQTLNTAKAVEAAGEAFKGGKYLKGAAQTLLATAPQSPFGILPAIAYGPELGRGLAESAKGTAQGIQEGNYGQAAESAAGGLGLAAMGGLIYKGVKGDFERASRITAEASAPIRVGAEAAAAHAGEMAGVPPMPPQAAAAAVPPPQMVAPEVAPEVAPVAPPVAPAPMPATGVTPEVRSAPAPIPGTTAAAVMDPTGLGAEVTLGGGTADRALADNAPTQPPQAAIPAPILEPRPVVPEVAPVAPVPPPAPAPTVPMEAQKQAPAPVETPGQPQAAPTPSRPAAERDSIAVEALIDQAFDPTSRVSKISADSLEKAGVNKKRAKEVGTAATDLLDQLTDTVKEGKFSSRKLKQEVNGPAILAATQAKYPKQAEVLDRAYQRIAAQGEAKPVQPEPVSAERVQPPTVDAEALRASILEGVDLRGDPNAPALVGARLKLRSLSPDQAKALAGLYPEQPVKGPASVVSQSLARRLGLTQPRESFRADGTVMRAAIPKMAAVEPTPAAATPAPVELPKPAPIPVAEKLPEVKPIEAALAPAAGVDQYRATIAERITRKQGELTKLDPKTEAYTELERSLTADQQHLSRVDTATKTFPELGIDEALRKLDEVVAEAPIRVPREVPENVPPESKVGGEAGAFTAKTSLGEPVTKQPADPAEVRFFNTVDGSDPKAVQVRDAIVTLSQSDELARKAKTQGVDLATLDDDIRASLLENTHSLLMSPKNTLLKDGATAEEITDAVRTTLLGPVGTNRLRSALKAQKLRDADRNLAETVFSSTLSKEGPDAALNERLAEADPSGQARAAIVKDILSRNGHPNWMSEAILSLNESVEKLRKGGMGGKQWELAKPEVEAAMAAAGETGDPRAFLKRVLKAKQDIEANFGKQEGKRIKPVFDGLADTVDATTQRGKDLREALSNYATDPEGSYQSLWQRAVASYEDMLQVSEYLKGKGQSRAYGEYLDRLKLYRKGAGEGGASAYTLNDLLGAAKAIATASNPDNLAERLKSLEWDGKAKTLRKVFRNALEELNPGGKDAPLDTPAGFEPFVSAKYEGAATRKIAATDLTEYLFRHYEGQNRAVSSVLRTMSLKDPLEALGKQITPPVRKDGMVVRQFRDRPIDPTSTLTLSLDSSVSRASEQVGEEIKLGPEGMKPPKEGFPRIEAFTGGTGNLAKLLNDFAFKLQASGTDHFLVSTELPDRIGRLLDDPATWADSPVHVERVEALDSPERIGYKIVMGGGTEPTPRPTGVRYQAEPVGKDTASWARFLNEGTIPQIKKESVEALFPGKEVSEGTNSFAVQLPNGSSLIIHKTGFIAIDEKALKEGYGAAANPDEYLATGSFQTLGPDGLIKIVKGRRYLKK